MHFLDPAKIYIRSGAGGSDAVGKARDQFIGIEHLSDQQIELIRGALEKQARPDKPARSKSKQKSKQETAGDTVDRLLDRF